MYNNTYRKVGAPVEDMMKVLRYGFSVLVHEDMVIQAIQSPYAWNNHSIWGGRERETERERGGGGEEESPLAPYESYKVARQNNLATKLAPKQFGGWHRWEMENS
jgi:hypothetical protein